MHAFIRLCAGFSIAAILIGCSEPTPRYQIIGGKRAEATDRAPDPPNGGPSAQAEDDGDPEHGAERSAASRADEATEVPVQDRLPPARGRTVVVGPEQALVEGTSYPSGRLVDALRALSPGDRLILEAGTYEGPIRIDSEMRDGRNPEPIQVVAETDAVLTITDKDSEASAVLEVQRSFWEFHGLEVRAPLVGVGGVELREVKTVLFSDCHIHNLGGAAVRALDRVREVRIQNSHLHQLGLGRRPTDAYGVSLADARTQLVVEGSQIHHTALGALSIAGSVIKTAAELANWDNVVIRDSEIK